MSRFSSSRCTAFNKTTTFSGQYPGFVDRRYEEIYSARSCVVDQLLRQMEDDMRTHDLFQSIEIVLSGMKLPTSGSPLFAF